MKMRRLLMAAAGLAALGLAGGATAATTYISDPNLADFATNATNFATLSNYHEETFGIPPFPGVDATTFSVLKTGDRVYDGGGLTGLTGSLWILATFSSPESSIRVFPNIDHASLPFDGYQYSIFGSNNKTSWTPLFNPLTVGSGPPFKIATFTGTAPSRVDDTVTGACAAGPDCVGYIADFNFGTAYKYYAIGSSSLSRTDGANTDEEISGVSAIGVPEPASWAMLLGGLGLVGATLRSSRRKTSLTTA